MTITGAAPRAQGEGMMNAQQIRELATAELARRDRARGHLERGEVRYMGHRPDLEAGLYAIRPAAGTPPLQYEKVLRAALDLLAACSALLQHCVTPGGFPEKGKGRTDEQQAAYDAARAAIAKATGAGEV